MLLYTRRAGARLCIALGAAGLLAGSVLPLTTQAAQASGGVQVFVGYADNVRANPANFPTPWEGSPGVIYEGCSPSSGCAFDGGAVRVVNNSGSPVTLNSVVLQFSAGCTYDIWPHDVALPAGGQVVVTQTSSGAADGCTPGVGQMDSSDIGPGGVGWAGNCSQSGVIPEVDVTIDGVTTAFHDSGQVLNTGGVDGASCPPLSGNESTQWTLVGTQPCAGADLSLSPPSQNEQVGDTATVTGTLTNGCGTPLQGATMTFGVASGPNAGTTGAGPTDANGQATFSYSSLSVGTDSVQASVTNPAGTITSNAVQVNWTAPFAPGGGAFVIGNKNSAAGSSVTFWSAHWADLNPLTTGVAPASFKGFALRPSAPSCGVAWTTDPGNSSPSPAGPLPKYMAVIVASSVTKSGSAITGDTAHIVVVRTDQGYAPDPGHAGTGTVVSQVC
jgi:uncharacterized protein YbdZ (MbtH family)